MDVVFSGNISQICFHAFSAISVVIYLWNSSDDDKEDEEAIVMKAIKKCTKSMGKCSVEQTATLMAWSEKNGLDVEKYHKRVIDQLEEADD